MSERSILITGCSSGIGLCAAQVLHDRGYRVLATARKAEDVERLGNMGLESYQLDLASSESVAAGAAEALRRTRGGLYALFNNGGYGQPGAVEDLSRDVLRAQFETNVLGWHQLSSEVLPSMRQQKRGRIVQNSSILGLIALRFRGAYVASKFAVEGLTDALRLELSGSGVYVSILEPGPIASRFRENAFAAYKTHIEPGKSAHKRTYRAVEARLAAEDDVGSFTLGADAVVGKLIHALESRRPKPRYYVTAPTYLLGGLRRVLPTRALDAILRAISRAEVRPVPEG